MMEMRQLQYIIAIEETGSFTKAARRCHVAQPALSQQVGKLERELGVRLFDRDSRRVQVTAAGQPFIKAARESLAALDLARSEAMGSAESCAGRLRLGTIPGGACIKLGRLLSKFHRRYPGIVISLREDVSERLLGDVEQGLVDLAVVATAPDDALERVSKQDIGSEMLKALVPVGHPLLRAGTAALGDLAGQTFAAMVGCPTVQSQVDEAFRAAGLTRRIAFEFDSPAELSEIVGLGLAVSLLPASMAEQIATAPGSRCRVLPVTGPGLKRSLKLIWAKEDAGLAHATRAFLPYIESELLDTGAGAG